MKTLFLMRSGMKRNKTQKKICFFMATPFTRGGEQRVVSIVSNLLVEAGYDVTILCTDSKTPVDNSLYNLSDKVNIRYVDGYNGKYVSNMRQKRHKLYLENLTTGKYKDNFIKQKLFINCDLITRLLLIRAFRKGKYDYIVSVASEYNMMLACVSRMIKAKTIGWQNGCFERYFDTPLDRHYNQDKFSRYMFKRLDAYVVLTKHDKKCLKKKFGVDTTVINNPKTFVSEQVSKLDNKQFLAVGRFKPVKNFSGLIDNFNEFHKHNKKWKLVIIGEGELEGEYKKKIKEYGFSDFVKIKKYTKNILKCYLESSVYLMNSLVEGWGMVIGEAMECGLPVISTNISSAPELIKDGQDGFIVKNDKEFIEKMLLLAKDGKLLKKMAKNAKEASDKRKNKNTLKCWIKLFESLE